MSLEELKIRIDNLSGALSQMYKHIPEQEDRVSKLFDTTEKLIIELNEKIKALENENQKLKDDIREMKRQYNHHIHRDNYTQIFHADRMEPCVKCQTKN